MLLYYMHGYLLVNIIQLKDILDMILNLIKEEPEYTTIIMKSLQIVLELLVNIYFITIKNKN